MYAADKIRNQKLLYPELSYEVVGALLAVYKELGPGLPEKSYQKAIAEELRHRSINFKGQVAVKVEYPDVPIGTYYPDFVIQDKLILEIKTDRFLLERI